MLGGKMSRRISSGNIIESLQNVQEKHGFLPRDSLIKLSQDTRIPLSRIFGVATFYHQFRLEPPGRVTIAVCMGTACHLRGNAENYEFLKRFLSIGPGRSTSDDGLFSLEKARCFGCCSLAPVVKIGDMLIGKATPRELQRAISRIREEILREEAARETRG
jgi:NADH-quinone oxidoreductase subunit E